MSIEKVHKMFCTSKALFFTVLFAFIAVHLLSSNHQWDNPYLWGNLLIHIGIPLLLLQLNYTFNITQNNTFIPALFYLLIVGGNPLFHNEIKGSIAAVCLIFSYYFLFKTYQKPESQINALNISLLLAVGSIFRMPFLFLFPVFWMGFHHFQSLNFRVFFASLTGFFTVYLFIFTFSVFKGDENIFFSLIPEIGALLVINKPVLTIWEWSTYGFLLIIWVITGFYIYISNISERVLTVTILGFFYFSSFILFVLFFLQTEYKSSWGIIACIPIAFLTGHFFTRSKNKRVHYLLLLTFLFLIGMGVIQHIGT